MSRYVATEAQEEKGLPLILPFESNLYPEITGEIFDAIAKDKGWQASEIARCEDEPWYWLVNYCYSRRKELVDGIDKTFVERIPPKDYLQTMAQDWYEHPLYAISKSRQMLATWLMTLLHLHICFFDENIHVFCQSQKEEDADLEMIQRANFTWVNLPFWMREYSPAKYSFCKLKLLNKSNLMQAIPAGGHQIRSHNPNYLMSDEIAFQTEAEESYTAALACCHKITLITSANPSWARDFYKDRIKGV